MDDDWRLLEAWQGGDRAAADALLRRYFKPLGRFFRRKVSNSDDVADLVSETMLECAQSTAKAREGVPFRSFLFSVGMNMLRRHFRKQAKRNREVNDFARVFAGDLDSPPSMASMVSADEQGQLLARALRKLPLEMQLVLELSLIECLNGPEIAEMLAIPRPTVYTRLRRGTERLRKTVVELAESPEMAESTAVGIKTWAKRVRAEAPD